MNSAAPTSPDAASCGDESHLWLPPRRLKRYRASKIAAALLMAGIFAGWMVIQWSIPAMRYFAGALLIVTVWVLGASLIQDRRRDYGRQIAVVSGKLIVTSPQETRDIVLAQLHHGQWNEESAGLCLLDSSDRTVANLDTDFLADENEARQFLHWLREQTDIALRVDWPATPLSPLGNVRS